MAASLTLMLKTTVLSDKLAFEKIDYGRPTFGRNNDNSKIDEFGVSGDSMEYAKKLKKLKGQKLSKSGKKLSKSGNLPKFNTKKARSNFITFDNREFFNRL